MNKFSFMFGLNADFTLHFIMALTYHKKKDTFDDNTADPWNVYGVDYGESAKADSEKATHELKATTEDLPTLPLDEDEELSTDIPLSE